MAPLTKDDVKAYLRIQYDAADDLIEELLASAQAAVAAWLGIPIYLTERTFEIDTCVPLSPSFYAQRIMLPVAPIGAVVSITDDNGDAVSILAADLRVNLRAGILSLRGGGRFDVSPYTVVATIGLQALDEFDEAIEPVINHAVRDTFADLWQRRNPAARAEREGGGVSVEYDNQIRPVGADSKREDLLPPRVAAYLAPWRSIGV